MHYQRERRGAPMDAPPREERPVMVPLPGTALKVPEALARKIEAEAARRGIAVSQLVREILTRWAG